MDGFFLAFKKQMMSDGAVYCGGIFREEIAQQLLYSCMCIVKTCFNDLFVQCERKRDGCDIFRSCVDTVRTSWAESDFSREVSLVTTCSSADVDVQVRGTFVVFVRQSYTDATGVSTINIRVSIPPTNAFMREFLCALGADDDFHSGAYFRVQNRLEQRDVIMQAIRCAFKVLSSDFVYVSDKHIPVEVKEEHSVSPQDSVSEAGEAQLMSEKTGCESKSDISINIKQTSEVEPSRRHENRHRRHDGDSYNDDDRQGRHKTRNAHSGAHSSVSSPKSTATLSTSTTERPSN